jgi:protein TonB
MTVELFELPPPPPPPAAPPPAAAAPPPPAAAAPVRAQPRVVREPAATPPAPTPAQAAEVVAQESPSDQPVDLTSFTIATGSGQRYAGGKTSSGGTSTQAVTGAASADGVPNGTGTGTADLSRPVRLADSEWECPWPAEADSLGIDEQAVLMRVVVRANGSVESAELVSDPGNGFGQAALACARRSRFEPALDRGGAALRARSGPIRVLFTR